MNDWIKKIVDAFSDKPEEGPRPDSVREYLRWFNGVLDDFAELYRDCAATCAQLDASQVGEPPEMMYGIMRELLRGLLLKLFIEVARADGEWHAVERRMARTLLQRVWSEPIPPREIGKALERIERHADALKWERLLQPFRQIEALEDRKADLETLIMRFTHLVAKADGTLAAEERETLREIFYVVREELHRPPLATEASTLTREEALPGVDPVAAPASAAQQMKEQARTLRETREAKEEEVAAEVLPDEEQRKQMLADAHEKLNNLIGLQTVKEEIDRLIDFIRLQEQRASHGLPTTEISLHCVFCGNPGTGKTTVARLFGQVLGGLGVLRRGQLIETDRSGLVAEYVGQTGAKAKAVIDTALDGVLFIDEAYSLVAEKQDDAFGAEAVQVLLKRMEDDRERLIVVVAGYPEPMEKMISINPGMRSRFQRTITFADYTPEELEKIFLGMSERDHYVLTAAALEKLREILGQAHAERDSEFGNGRFVRNLFEDAVSRLASRVVDVVPITKELLTTFEAEDLVRPAD